MARPFWKLLLAGAIACAVSLGSRGVEPEAAADEYAMTLEENIAYPPVSGKKGERVREAMRELRKRLSGKKFSATMERNEEVVCIVVPASDLFRANAVELSAEGRRRLHELEQYVAHSGQFKVLVAVHSDDTGDEEYADELTSTRANAIDDYFEHAAGRELNIIPYGIGRDEPVGSNSTKKGRFQNRRVEIFFVPTAAYIKNLTSK
ncbi:MAG: OmpA family protein [Muribaculaceae bacterium]|nr:OmpA family protein [Muribaculaceae bacterium]